jgi:hypothetical protein
MEIRQMKTINNLDLTCEDTNEMAAFLKFCYDRDVVVSFVRARGMNGYPVANFSSYNVDALHSVMIEYCGGDEDQAEEYMSMVVYP